MYDYDLQLVKGSAVWSDELNIFWEATLHKLNDRLYTDGLDYSCKMYSEQKSIRNCVQ